ncbi:MULTISPECIES: CDP-alcohol phosphatidyltransferase family protein [unclassified Brevibacterium]|uniref:CDP-alcohol phosphatidyltransferase family protein n=1 Tax=unclassified Brevibacterium TaxID=2614124 RepID=UPI001E52921E|nr:MULTISPECIES: CDP-alcohol phosphatidyltransferase family protein [unclassified Brevibacterium]MCD1285532.1 transferase [Brevibacterium sp. CCUG 69071]MDK8434586.1 CDP-alcohol phosphatidyltransferase family protein [Brevibacterium sp. H-BE7]
MDSAHEPSHPTLSELRAKAQPPEVRSRKNAEHWTAQLYLRHISIYFTMLLVRTRISANGVTGLMIFAGWCIAASLLIPGIWGALLAVFFSQVQMYIDCCDGEVARWRETSGAKGVFLDKVGHYTTEGLVAVALGIRAVGEWQNLSDDPAGTYRYLLAGTVLAGFVLLNKALNDMVHVSRAFNGLDKLTDSKEATALTPGLVAKLKRAARFVPFHRIYHSVEMSLMAVIASVVTMIAMPLEGGPLFGERWLILIMAPLCLLSVIGHFMAIMASKRLS